MFDVYLYDARIGRLTPRGRGVRFEYTRDALEDNRLPALSLSLPKRAEPYPDSKAGPFFRNLLPEQAFRRLVAAAAGEAPENSTALLGAIGGECPGAVSIWPADTPPPPTPEYEALRSSDLRSLFSTTHRDSLASAITRGRLSLAGAQDKIALLRDTAGAWRKPLNGAVTSHILKQSTVDYAHILENELVCMRLARECGLTVPDVGFPVPDVHVFCIERFDRPVSAVPDRLRDRLHQEDLCQVLGVEMENKYEEDGGPGLRRCADVIRRHSGLPAEDLTRLIHWVVFNYLIGNEDAHAKNLAILYEPRELRLAPHYDLLSTVVYPDLPRKLAMKIGGSWDIRNVQGSDWQRAAEAMDVPWDQLREGLLDIADHIQVVHAVVMGQAEADFGPAPVYERVSAVIAQQVSHLEKSLRRR